MASKRRKSIATRQPRASQGIIDYEFELFLSKEKETPRASQGIIDYEFELFLSKEKETRYHSVINFVKLHNEKWLSSDILVSNIAIIKSWLEGMGWFDYLCSSHTIYPRLVKLFYANLDNSTTCVANSSVLGNNVSIIPDLIAETLGIPNSGITHFNDVEKLEAIGICLERPDFDPIMTVTSSHLPIATRILLLLVINPLLPREGSHTLPSERDLKFVACIKNGTLVNLPYLIINHMLSRPNHIPYQLLISRTPASLNLEIPDDEHTVKPSHKQLINKAGLRNCNIRFEDGMWVKQHAGGREQVREPANVRAGGDDEEEDDDDGQQFEMRPNVGASSSSSSRPTLESLQARMDLAQADIDYLRGRVDQIYEGQATLIQMFQNAFPQNPHPRSS
ncbi:hypothetical protein CFOL_v3_25888 [Cephalotus follicularis]|uniref:Putative plant transposon protein domain-containing protein n=1 Tax=Cephalotus follicularis TaxID=3775 RepID=A0A1Q3CQA1_CEPFO|nr:hypothetical protein CFOL_v3_25888 [Cephalotus follicularis]